MAIVFFDGQVVKETQVFINSRGNFFDYQAPN